ncbi:MAG: hypothetical protein ACRDAX_05450 [Propionibacteriaceae bacterium]
MEEKLGVLLGVSNSQTGLDLRPSNTDGGVFESVDKSRKRRHGYEKMEENKRRQTKWQIISGKISELLESTAICPLEGIKSEVCFLKDDMLTDPDNSTKVNKAIEVWSHKINNYTLREFYDMYLRQKPKILHNTEPLFNRAMSTLNKNFDPQDMQTLSTMFKLPKQKIFEPITRIYRKEYFDGENVDTNLYKDSLIFSRSKTYYNMEDSFKYVDKLLNFQFDGDEDMIKHFLQSLVNVLDWQPESRPGVNIKCNTFLVHSAPSAGKNFFFDTILTLFLNFGQLGTANKSNNFAFQDAANRRVILWNEPNYESSCTDYLKTLFEGGDTKVRVKMLGDSHIKRTPIIILTNNVVNFMTDNAFKDRIKQFKWKAAPFLKDCKLKPYPLVFFDILLKYEIKF